MQEAFEGYVEEFTSLMKEVETSSNQSEVLQQAHDLLQQLTVEARGMESDKKTYLDRVKVYKSQWQAAKLDVDHKNLMERQGSSSGQKSQLQQTEDAIARQNASLAQAAASIHKTEELAMSITENLAENRETLERSHANTKEVTSLSQRANEIAANLLKPWWRKGL